MLRSGRLRRFLALVVDSYDLELGQKPQHPEMCELGPIAYTDHSQTNFLLILHTFLPMRVSCYRTKHAAICTCKDWIGPIKTAETAMRIRDPNSARLNGERLAKSGSRCRTHFDGRFEDPAVGKVPG